MRKWRENEEMKRKWRENEEIERKFLVLIVFDPTLFLLLSLFLMKNKISTIDGTTCSFYANGIYSANFTFVNFISKKVL